MITPYKNRKINYDKSVRIHRNLNRRGKVYSILQNGLVVGYTSFISLTNCKFIVKSSGKARALETKQRNVHAFIEGYISNNPFNTLPIKVKYHPFNNQGFIDNNKIELTKASNVVINNEGVSADNVT